MNVTIYSTPTCPFCKQAKSFLEEHYVKFMDINVSADQTKAEEMIKLSGQMGVPVIVVGEEVLVGFDKKKLGELVGVDL